MCIERGQVYITIRIIAHSSHMFPRLPVQVSGINDRGIANQLKLTSTGTVGVPKAAITCKLNKRTCSG